MHIAILQHMAHEGPGSLADWARERGHSTRTDRLDLGGGLPATDDFDLLVVLGGAMGVHDVAEHFWLAGERALIRAALDGGKRVLGICLGAQQIAHALGAEVYPNDQREVGFWPIRRTDDAIPLPDELTVLHWHGDTFDLPEGATLLAESAGCRNQVFIASRGHALGLQCHLEATPELVDAFCTVDAAYLATPPGQSRWMQDAATMHARHAAYAPMRAALFNLLDAFTA